MLLYFGSKSMMPTGSALVCESAHRCSTRSSYITHVCSRSHAGPPLRTGHRRRDRMMKAHREAIRR